MFITGGRRTPAREVNSILRLFSASGLAGQVLSSLGPLGNEKTGVFYGTAIPTGQGPNPIWNAGWGKAEGKVLSAGADSGLTAIAVAANFLKTGRIERALAGGADSYTRAPQIISARKGCTLFDEIAHDSAAIDAFWDWTSSYAAATVAEAQVKEYELVKESLDQYALESHELAARAHLSGRFVSQICPLTIDEGGITAHSDSLFSIDPLRAGRIFSALPCFYPSSLDETERTLTSENVAKPVDAAAFVELKAEPKTSDGSPVFELLDQTTVTLNWDDIALAPSIAVEKILFKHKLRPFDVRAFEVDEWLPVAPLVFLKRVRADRDKLNSLGGSIAFGNGLAANGARMLINLMSILAPGELGVAAGCSSGSQSTAVLIKRIQ